ANTLTLALASNPFSGALNINGAVVNLTQGSGLTSGVASTNLPNVSSISVVNGGGLTIDNSSALLQANRVNDTATISLRNTGASTSVVTGLTYQSDQGSTITPRLETVGAVSLDAGANTLRANASGNLAILQLALTSLTRNNNSTLAVLGSFMEDPVSVRRGDILVNGGVSGLVGGGGLMGSPSVSILPWAIGTNAGATVTGILGNTFVTFNPTSKAFRALTSGEYEQLVAAGGATSTNNVRYSAGTDLTLSTSAATMNALLVDNSSTTTAITLSGAGTGATLTIASGAVLFTGSATPQGITLGGFASGISTASGEYIFTQNNTSAAGVTISSDLVSAAALTKSGPGLLKLLGSASNLNGNVTINQGVLGINALTAIGSRPVVFYGTGTFSAGGKSRSSLRRGDFGDQ
ncbi:MAG: hypothetical protein EBS01_11865, partial [Verrucomicrobia bacterium]|nr:hypothetical protein [Verrucomicrobiota bacterium]